jgi:hypothetical protein
MDTTLRSLMPAADEFAPYYGTYISAVPAGDILITLANQRGETHRLLGGISEAKSLFAYAPGKWNIREVMGHVIDAERVFAYRALRVSRQDATPLPSFDQDLFVKNGNFSGRTIKDLAEEFDHVRLSTLDLLSHFADDAWSHRGTASNNPVTPRSLAWIIAGHEFHHMKIIREKYLG